jgi:predicted DNA-binding ribbon-helix-helix protein
MPHRTFVGQVYITGSSFGKERVMRSSPVKRSIVINGQKSSISLEEPFWSTLKDIAHERRVTLSHLVASIDTNRQSNLSSSIRLFVLEYYKDRVAQLEQREIPVAKRRKRR